MKRILIYICALFITFYCNKIFALECSQLDKETLQKLANNVSYILEEVNDGDDVSFNVTFTGVSKELRMYIPSRYSYMKTYEEYLSELVVNSIKPGMPYRFRFYGTDNCKNELFRTITIQTPNYNVYHDDPLCKQASEYSLCQKWSTNSYSYDEFVKNVNDYISNKQNNASSGNNFENLDEFDFNFDFGKFYKLVYFPSLIVTIILIILLIIFWNKENKRNKL